MDSFAVECRYRCFAAHLSFPFFRATIVHPDRSNESRFRSNLFVLFILLSPLRTLPRDHLLEEGSDIGARNREIRGNRLNVGRGTPWKGVEYVECVKSWLVAACNLIDENLYISWKRSESFPSISSIAPPDSFYFSRRYSSCSISIAPSTVQPTYLSDALHQFQPLYFHAYRFQNYSFIHSFDIINGQSTFPTMLMVGSR